VAEARGPLADVLQLIEQDRVGGGPSRGRLRPGSLVPQEESLLFHGEFTLGVPAQHAGIAPQGEEDGQRVDGRPDVRDVLSDRGAPGDRVLDAVVGGVTAALHRQEDVVGQALGEDLSCGVVAHAPLAQLLEDLVDLVCRDTPAVCSPRHGKPLGRRPDVGPDRPTEHLGHPGVTLEHSRRCRGGGAGGARRPQLLSGRVADLDLAEGWQDRTDVVEEGPVRADDEDPGPRQPVPERVEQPCGPVQADGGLPRARRTLDAHRGGGVGAHDLVLLGLDRRDDVPHRAHPGPLDLRHENATVLASPRARVLEVLVLVGGQPAPVDPEPPSQADAHRFGPRRAVEGAGEVGAPVDDDRVAVLVVDVPSTDVPPLGGSSGGGAHRL